MTSLFRIIDSHPGPPTPNEILSKGLNIFPKKLAFFSANRVLEYLNPNSHHMVEGRLPTPIEFPSLIYNKTSNANGFEIKTNAIYIGDQSKDLTEVKTFDLLKSLGADLTSSDNNAIVFAASKGKPKLLNYLINDDADPCAQDCKALNEACKNGHVEMVKFLIEIGSNPSNRNEQPMANALGMNHTPIVKILEGYGLNLKNPNGMIIACENGNLEAVMKCKELGFDLKGPIKLILKALSSNGHLHVLKYLDKEFTLSRSDMISAIPHASVAGHFELLSYLLNKINELDKELDKSSKKSLKNSDKALPYPKILIDICSCHYDADDEKYCLNVVDLLIKSFSYSSDTLAESIEKAVIAYRIDLAKKLVEVFRSKSYHNDYPESDAINTAAELDNIELVDLLAKTFNSNVEQSVLCSLITKGRTSMVSHLIENDLVNQDYKLDPQLKEAIIEGGPSFLENKKAPRMIIHQTIPDKPHSNIKEMLNLTSRGPVNPVINTLEYIVSTSVKLNNDLFKYAILVGNLDVLSYLKKLGLKPKKSHFRAAISTCNIQMVRLLEDCGLEVNPKNSSKEYIEGIFEELIKTDSIEMFNYLEDRLKPALIDDYIDYMVSLGSESLLRYVYSRNSNRSRFKFESENFIEAISKGYIDIANFILELEPDLVENAFEIQDDISSKRELRKSYNISMMKFLLENLRFDDSTLKRIIVEYNDSIDIMVEVMKQNTNLADTIYDTAFTNHRYNVLNWLLDIDMCKESRERLHFFSSGVIRRDLGDGNGTPKEITKPANTPCDPEFDFKAQCKWALTIINEVKRIGGLVRRLSDVKKTHKVLDHSTECVLREGETCLKGLLEDLTRTECRIQAYLQE